MKQQLRDDLPKLSQPARRALAGIGITRLEQLTQVTEADLMKLHGFGKKGLEMLREAMTERGLLFKAKK